MVANCDCWLSSPWLTMSHPVLILAMPFGNNTISGGRRHWSPPSSGLPCPIDHRVIAIFFYVINDVRLFLIFERAASIIDGWLFALLARTFLPFLLMKPRLCHPPRLLDTYDMRVILAILFNVCFFGRPHRRMNEYPYWEFRGSGWETQLYKQLFLPSASKHSTGCLKSFPWV